MRKVLLFFLLYSVFMLGMTVVALAEEIGYRNKSSVSSKTKAISSAGKSKLNPSVKTKKLDAEKDNPGAKNITFDFPNTKLNVFARFVAKLCGEILIGEELLIGNININSQTKLSIKEVKDLLRAVLYSKGLGFTENNIYMEIIHRSDSITEVYKLNYLKASDLAKSLSQMFRMSFRVANKPVNIQITAIDAANSIMVLAPAIQQMEIAKTIKKMDRRTRQVMLNIMVLEVTKKSTFGFGVDAIFSDQTASAAGGTTAGLVTSGGTVPTNPMKFSTKGVNSAGGVTYSKGNWTIDVQGVDQNTRLKVLTQPRIMAANNQKAEIKIGKKQPYVTTSAQIGGGTAATGGSGNASTSSTIATDDVGITIELTPRINDIKDVTLEFKMTITSIVDSLSVISGTSTDSAGKRSNNTNDVPNIGHRTIDNTSNIISGEVLVIGGMLKNQKVVIKTAPPVLGDIPWVGWMFAQTSEVTEQVELMVFISPTVIFDSDEGDAVTKKETNQFRNYDLKTKGTLDQMLTGKNSLSDDVFNFFDYFSNGKYRSEQGFIAQPGSLL